MEQLLEETCCNITYGIAATTFKCYWNDCAAPQIDMSNNSAPISHRALK